MITLGAVSIIALAIGEALRAVTFATVAALAIGEALKTIVLAASAIGEAIKTVALAASATGEAIKTVAFAATNDFVNLHVANPHIALRFYCDKYRTG
jgi:protein-arginine kinase